MKPYRARKPYPTRGPAVRRAGAGRNAVRQVWRDRPYATAAAVGAGALAGLWALNGALARRAERRNPPLGRFVTVRGVRLHYIDLGEGEPLVLLHGNGSMVEDFVSSGLVRQCAGRFRVIAFDRPGYGRSTRPRGRVWTPAAQAEVIGDALERLGVGPATVLGHSWGTSVAVALAIARREAVRALVLVSGYYYPTARADVPIMSGPAVPVIGDVMRHTVSPMLGRLIWPVLMRKIFGPRPTPPKFEARFPREMALRPSQIRASAAESALMIPDAWSWRGLYRDLQCPVVIVAGADDRLVDPARQSARLHRELPHSTLHVLGGQGHMVHQTATSRVLAAIDEAATAATRPPG